MTPQEIVERALSLSKADGCVVIVDDVSTANLRWAANTLTTNGVMQSRSVTVIAVVNGTHGADGASAGVVSRSRVTQEALEELVRETGPPRMPVRLWIHVKPTIGRRLRRQPPSAYSLTSPLPSGRHLRDGGTPGASCTGMSNTT